jgi:hypothetical protein
MFTKRLASAAVCGFCLTGWLVLFGPHASAQSVEPASVIARFSGIWEMDETKFTVGPSSEPNLRFQRNAKGELEELKGPEARPVVLPVIFDGKPHEIDGGSGTRVAWTQIDSITFESLLTDGQPESGRVGSSRRLRISSDGNTLTEEIERKAPVTSLQTVVYRRMSEGPGLAGRWKPESVKTNPPLSVKWEPAGTNGVKVSDPRSTFTIMFDRKSVPLIGLTGISNTMLVTRVLDDYTIEINESREGIMVARNVWTVSRDGKTLTATVTPVGPNDNHEPSVVAYVKK